MRRSIPTAIMATLALPLALGACSQEPREGDSAEDFAERIGDSAPGEQAGPAPQMTTAAAPTADAEGNPYAEGKWFVTEDAQSARAMFGPPQSEPRLTLACDQGSKSMEVIRAGAADAAGDYTISVGGQRAGLRLAPAGAELPRVSGSLPASHPIFAALAKAGQSATISGPGGDSLYVPGSAAIRRVLTACGVST